MEERGWAYGRRRPEGTVLYEAVRDNLATLLEEASEVGRGLPRYVERDFTRYLECGVLAHGFARVRCESYKDELLVAFSCKGRGVCPSCNALRNRGNSKRPFLAPLHHPAALNRAPIRPSVKRPPQEEPAPNDFYLLVRRHERDKPRPLDGVKLYFAFGRVVKGMDVVRAIQQSPRSEQKLTPPVRILKALRQATPRKADRPSPRPGESGCQQPDHFYRLP